MTTELITWHPISEPPDSNAVVLLFDEHGCEPVWPGYKDENGWRYIDGHRASPSQWTEMPGGPR
jgi:hypothetical protein